MRNVEIDKGGFRYKWTVRGVDEGACVEDIWDNQRTRLTDYMTAAFAEQYGCVAEVERVRLMTRNQYQAFLQRIANRVSSEDGYTMADYRRDAGLVEVLPFSLESFGLNEEVQKRINQYFDSVSYMENGDVRFGCHVGSLVGVSLIAEAFDCDAVCNQGFDGFYKNDSNRFILGFWDGEVSFLICISQRTYEAQLAELHAFYEMEDNDVCLEVYCGDVHVDNLVVPRENVEMAISSVLQREIAGEEKGAEIRFRAVDVEESLEEKPLVERLVDAIERADGGDVEVSAQREKGLF